MNTIIELFKNTVQTATHKNAFEIWKNKGIKVSISYQNFYEKVLQYAKALSHVGISQYDRVIVMVYPDYEFYVIMTSLLFIGGIPVLMDPSSGAKSLAVNLAKVQAKAFIGLPLSHIFRFLFAKHFKDVQIWINTGKRAVFKSICLSKIVQQDYNELPGIRYKKSDCAIISFTTGSTGNPKGAVYTHLNLFSMYLNLKHAFQIEKTDRTISTFPPFNMFDILFGLTTTVIPSGKRLSGGAKKDSLLEIINKQQVSLMFCSPNILNQLVQNSEKSGLHNRSLKTLIAGGAPLSPGLIKKIKKILHPGAKIYNTYGATEALQIAAIDSEEILNETGYYTEKGMGYCVGVPLKGVEIKIITIYDQSITGWDRKMELQEGETGELLVLGDHVSPSYFNNTKENRKNKILIGDQIWHRTGDICRIDKKGRLWFLGRKKYRVDLGNECLFTPIEALFNTNPLVKKSALIGVKKNGIPIPVLCIEPEKNADKKRLIRELSQLAMEHEGAKKITRFYIYPKPFPVDCRHGSKINRDRIKQWLLKKI